MKSLFSRRFFAAVLCAGLLLAFSGCGESSDQSSSIPEISREQSTPDKAPEVSETTASYENSDYDDEFVKRMSVVDERVKLFCSTDEYKNGDIETKRSIATETLKKLEEEGYVRKGSIAQNDSNITYIYECCEEGVFGAIMLREFAPDVNGVPVD